MSVASTQEQPLSARGQVSFNLGARAWLPVLDSAGMAHLVGLRELFASPGEYRLDEDDPLVASALWRFLLAVTQAAFGAHTERQWQEAVQAGRLAPVVSEYLQENQDRFDLFDPDAPFFQDVSYWDKVSPDAAKVLVPNSPANLHPMLYAAGAPVLLDHRSNAALPTMPASLAARLLITKQCWSNGQRADGGGYCVGSPLWTGLAAIPLGDTVADTLHLAFFVCDASQVGSPVWSLDGPSGWVGRLAWPTRSALLIGADDPNGSAEPVVVGCVLGYEGQLTSTVSPSADISDVIDPMWVRSDRVYGKGDAAKYGRVKIVPARMVWRDLDAITAEHQTTAIAGGNRLDGNPGCLILREAVTRSTALGIPARIGVFGVDVERQQRPEAVANDVFPLTATLLGPLHRTAANSTLKAMIATGEAAAEAARKAVANAHKKTFVTSPDVGKSPAQAAEQAIWWHLNQRFRPTLAEVLDAARNNDRQTALRAEWAASCAHAAHRAYKEGVRTIPATLRGVAAVEKERINLTKTLEKNT